MDRQGALPLITLQELLTHRATVSMYGPAAPGPRQLPAFLRLLCFRGRNSYGMRQGRQDSKEKGQAKGMCFHGRLFSARCAPAMQALLAAQPFLRHNQHELGVSLPENRDPVNLWRNNGELFRERARLHR